MATTRRKPSKRRKPPGSSLFARPAPTRRNSDDPNGRYTISYQLPNAESLCVRPDTPWWRAKQPTLKVRVTGKRAMEATRSTLRSSGAVNIRVSRTNWFG